MTEGYVYAIESGNAVKIGFAHDPVRRLAELNVGSPGAHRLLGMARGTKRHESELHRLARAERIRGEWFRKGRVISLFLQHLPPYTPNAPRQVSPRVANEKQSTSRCWHIRQRLFRVTQKEFAKIAGASQTAVSRWESGETEPTIGQMTRIRGEAIRRGLQWDDSLAFELPREAAQ